jgi:hypothetical protein
VLVGVHGAGLMFIMFAAEEVGTCPYLHRYKTVCAIMTHIYTMENRPC